MTGNKIQKLDNGRVIVRPDFLAVLQANSLDTFEKIMAYRGGSVMRSVPGRSTVRIELNRPDGRRLVAYLKRYERGYLSFGKNLLRFLRWPGADDEALHEWNAIGQLRASGFNTADPIAVGQKKKCGAVKRSFLLTAEIIGGIAAHDYTRTLDAKGRRELLRHIAPLTRRFHQAGFAHKDYYLSHIFVVTVPVAGPQLFFIDLQRLVRPRFLSGYWLVKDLAALGYSGQLAGATRADMLCFYKACLGTQRLTSRDRRRIGRIMARVNALHRRGPKYDVIWDQPGVRPRNV